MTTTKTKVTTPKGLRTRGRRFWSSITAAYELTVAELELLLEACRTMDRLDELDEFIVKAGVTAVGSQGQMVINGALTEVRGHQLVLHRLIAALTLPDEEGATVPSSATLRAQTAGTARWAGVQTEASRRRGAS